MSTSGSVGKVKGEQITRRWEHCVRRCNNVYARDLSVSQRNTMITDERSKYMEQMENNYHVDMKESRNVHDAVHNLVSERQAIKFKTLPLESETV